ncbi:Glutamate receptor U1 [Folsomia candida]|uniref:Glutamate receptor U1 n=1 Tax=Folsomia candida TaxID=158441 RepID=A0A226D2X8_FOLCA|nr:Glutamate receptor U1 [Folsomia candida]
MATNMVQIDHLLDHVYPCDLQILHDGVESSTFHSNRGHLPTEILFRMLNKHPRFDLTKSRFAKCRVQIVLITFFTSLDSKWRYQHDPKKEMELASGTYFYCRPKFPDPNRILPIRDKKLFVVVVGHREKAGVLSLLLEWGTYNRAIDNLGIAYISREGSLARFCVKDQGVTYVHEGDLNCVEKIDNAIMTFINLATPPKYWYFDVRSLSKQKDNFGINITLVNDIDPFNPFDRSQHYTVEHLAQAMFRKANATLATAVSERINYAEIVLEEISYFQYDRTMVNLKFSGFQFLTCYAESYLSFRFYVDPFQPDLWIGLGICLFVITAIISLYVRYAKVENVSFSPWLFVLSTLLEEAHPVPIKIDKLTIFRYIFGIWSLMSVILTNCYNGLMISKLNSPLNNVIPETFADLLCEDGAIHSSAYYNSSDFLHNWREKLKINLISSYFEGVRFYEFYQNKSFVDLQNRNDSNNCYKLLSTPFILPGIDVIGFKFLTYVTKELDGYRPWHQPSSEWVPLLEWPHLAGMLQLLNPRHSHFPKGIDYSRKDLNLTYMQRKIETEIVDCSRKAVLIAQSDLLQFEYDFLTLNYHKNEFHKGKEILNPLPKGFVFKREGFSKVPKYYIILIETGIYARIEQELGYRAVLDRKPAISLSKDDSSFSLGLNGGVVTIFVLYGVAVAGSVLCYCFEGRSKICRLFGVLKCKIVNMMFDKLHGCKILSTK